MSDSLALLLLSLSFFLSLSLYLFLSLSLSLSLSLALSLFSSLSHPIPLTQSLFISLLSLTLFISLLSLTPFLSPNYCLFLFSFLQLKDKSKLSFLTEFMNSVKYKDYIIFSLYACPELLLDWSMFDLFDNIASQMLVIPIFRNAVRTSFKYIFSGKEKIKEKKRKSI